MHATLIRFISIHSVSRPLAVWNLVWRYARARGFFMRTSYRNVGSRRALSRESNYSSRSEDDSHSSRRSFPGKRVARHQRTTRAFLIHRFITFARPVPAGTTICSNFFVRRDNVREIGLLDFLAQPSRFYPSRKLTVQPPIGAFHYIRRYYLKRKTALFSDSPVPHFPGVGPTHFLPAHYAKLIMPYASRWDI